MHLISYYGPSLICICFERNIYFGNPITLITTTRHFLGVGGKWGVNFNFFFGLWSLATVWVVPCGCVSAD